MQKDGPRLKCAMHEVQNAKDDAKQQSLSILTHPSYFTNLFLSFS
jgi:hypothetical protein